MFSRAEFDETHVGLRPPPIELCELDGNVMLPVNTEQLFAGVRAVVLGVPGAFTPVCTSRHIPEFIR